MNSEELRGGTRYAVGKVEKTVGDVVDSRDWQVDGVVDQVAGGALHTYGRAKSIVEDAVDSAPALAEDARERMEAAGRQAADAAQRGGKVAVRTVQDQPVLWALAAAAGGYALAWFVHGHRA